MKAEIENLICGNTIEETIRMLGRWLSKVKKRAKIRNRYNQVPHLTQDTVGFCLFDFILNILSTIFQLNRGGSSLVEPVLS